MTALDPADADGAAQPSSPAAQTPLGLLAPARRSLLVGSLGSLGALAAWGSLAGSSLAVRPAQAAVPESLQAALRSFTAGATPRSSPGRVQLDIAPLVDNGNTVPVTVSVTSPMTAAAFVRRISLFTERNPQAEVVVFHLGPRSGRAVVSTRMRLATTQQVLAVAELSDGSFWQQAAEVVVTLAACIEA